MAQPGATEGLSPAPGAWGDIDKDGKTAINPQFDEGGNFEGGIAPVWIGNREGYIDKYGKYIWNPMRAPSQRSTFFRSRGV